MVTPLLGLIACILLFGPIGLVVFAAIMTCILPFYIVLHFTRTILGRGSKHWRKYKVVVETRGARSLYCTKTADGWLPTISQEILRLEETNEETV